MAAAVANRLSASLLFAMRKFGNEPGRAAAEFKQIERIPTQFEDYCVVTQSVRAAIPINVQVLDSQGMVVKS